MAIKRKAVAISAEGLFAGGRGTKKLSRADAKEEEDQEEMDPVIDGEEEEEAKKPKLSEKQRLANDEQKITSERQKELKAMYVDELKKFVSDAGLPTGKREDMISSLLKSEAKIRAQKRFQEAQTRAIVVEKKEELESLSASALKDLCAAQGVKGSSKPERVEQLLSKWLQDDGVNKARAKAARDGREEELCAMEKQELQKICTKEKLSPFVKDVVVERIVQRESELGQFSVPKKEDDGEAHENPSGMGNAVDVLLAKHKRDEEMASKKQAESEKVAKILKDLRAKPQDELKKMIASKGLEVSGKKEDMAQALLVVAMEDDALKARKSEVKALERQELAELLVRKGVRTDKNKDTMVKTLLAHEANLRQVMKEFELKMQEISARKQVELEGKTNAELKELCIAKGLPAGVGKEDRAKRLVEAARQEGELDKVYTKMIRNARSEALGSMDEPALLKICN